MQLGKAPVTNILQLSLYRLVYFFLRFVPWYLIFIAFGVTVYVVFFFFLRSHNHTSNNLFDIIIRCLPVYTLVNYRLWVPYTRVLIAFSKCQMAWRMTEWLHFNYSRCISLRSPLWSISLCCYLIYQIRLVRN